ncbi:MAG: hypothetical protein JJ911_01550 [Rhizobiaceae bacterium]|nr:hypothetical protein [Rhizobiaceae bacterium]
MATAGFTAAMLLGTPSAFAACPIELATYAGQGGTMAIEFRPTSASVTVTNSFRFLTGERALDGIVMWTAGTARSWGVVMDGCPEGDLTGNEISECTLWEGVVYAIDDGGKVGLLPGEGQPAPQTLILADLGPWLSQSEAWREAGSLAEPWDVFTLSGCQE